MGFLVDTNVVSELRKGDRADAGVRAWIAAADADELYLSVLTLGELRRGVELVRRRDATSADALDRWLQQLASSYTDRILPVTADIAERWGRLALPDPLPVVDALLAATAHVHGLTLVTRNEADVRATEVPLINPFHAP